MIDAVAVLLLDRLVAASIGGAVAVGVVWLVLRLVDAVPPRARCWLWWLAAAKFLVLLVVGPVASVPVLPTEPSASEATVHRVTSFTPHDAPVTLNASSTIDAAVPTVPLDGTETAPASNASLSLPTLLAVLWTAGAGLLLVRLVAGALRDRRRLARLLPVNDRAVLEPFDELRRTLGVKRCSLRWAEGGEVPRVTGLRRPTITIPRSVRSLDRHRLRLVLAHELLHLRRRDLWLGIVPAVGRALFFFHPFIHLAIREYRLAREAACDAAVLRRLRPNPRDYGRLLVELGVATRAAPLAAGAVTSRTDLFRRLTMLETRPDRRPWLPILVVLPILTAALVPFDLAASEPPPKPDPPAAAEPAPAPTEVTTAPAPAPPPRPEATPRTPATEAPSPPAAPTPAADSTASAHSLSTPASGDAFVLLLDDHTFFHGGVQEAEAARRHRHGDEEILWYRSADGEEWVIRDPDRIAAARKLYRPVLELGREQTALGKRQAELGSRQAELGRRQAELGSEQAELGERQRQLAARINELTARDLELQAQKLKGTWNDALAEEREELVRQRRRLETKMRSLGDSQGSLGSDQGELGARQAALGEQQAALGSTQAALGAEQRQASSRAETELRQIVEAAIAAGDAERVK